MLKLLFFRSRRYLSKLCAIFFILICYLVLRKLYYHGRELDYPNQNIVVNLKSSNQPVPGFMQENNEISSVKNSEKSKLEKNLDKISNSKIKSELSLNEEKDTNINDLEKPNVNYDYEEIIKAEEEAIISGLGEYGEPVTNIPNVTEEEIQKCMKKEAFNRILSDRISLTRKIPDARHQLCASVKYDEKLPSASVIIIFINEAWSTLIRTVHSVLIRSPANHLKEIILVDDASTRENLKGKLDYYLRTRLPDKVKLLRLTKRAGLIKARIAGAEIATGDVLVFLDSHCECGIDWLQPMLQRVKNKRNAVVCPIIDVIDDRNLGYMFSQDRQFQIGGFTWSGHFTWISIPDFEIKGRSSEIIPARSPTMAGGLFAIERQYFWKIGSYDPKMEIWGGENLEMSFRIWQCGGSLEIVPCTRVGHIFRSFHPYSFPDHKDTHGINTVRTVEVWMDDYKRLFYMHRPDLKNIDFGDISGRIKLREMLKCQDFKWYLQNVIPQKFILDENVVAYGKVRSKVRNFCFDNLNNPEDVNHDVGLYNCHEKLYSSQYFSLTLKGELRREELCAEVQLRSIPIPELPGGAKGNVTLVKCDDSSSQVWTYNNELIRHTETDYCIHSYNARPETLLTVAACNENDIYFKWFWEFTKLPDSDEFIQSMN